MQAAKFLRYGSIALAGLAGVRIVSRLLGARTLTGEVTFITGGSRGLGLAIASECARRGSHVAIAARDEDTLERAAAGLRDKGARVLPLVCDVRDPEQIASAIRRAHAVFGRIDTLVNNAGVIMAGPAQTMTQDDYREAMDTHFWAMYHAVEAVLPLFEPGRGRIVNITSIGGKVSVPHLLPYSTSKFAAVGYSEGLRAELAGKGVCVTTVAPGLMRTGSPRNAFFKSQHRKEYAWFSLADTMPGMSIAASSAARSIVDAALRGRAEIILSLPAAFIALVHGVAPGFTSNIMGIAARLLPGPGGIRAQRVTGAASESALTKSPLTALGRKAELDYNQR